MTNTTKCSFTLLCITRFYLSMFRSPFCLTLKASSIFNFGKGAAEVLNNIAQTVINLYKKCKLEHINFHDNLKWYYQSYTNANLDEFHKTDCKVNFRDDKTNGNDYLQWLEKYKI